MQIYLYPFIVTPFTSSRAFGAGTFVLGLHANERNFKVAQKENAVIFLEDDYDQNYDGFNPNDPESVISLILMQETYLDQSLQLASIIQNSFVSSLKRKSRGVKQNAFVVLYHTYMPSVLVETGFLSNKTEGTYLNSKNGQSKFAKAISDGIISYLDQIAENTIEDSIVDDDKSDFENINKDIIFKVQIASGSRKLETKSYNFKGLKGVERVKVGNSYKYYYGKTSNYDEVIDYQKEVKAKGYSSAYIIAFKKGEKISVQKALKTPQ